MHCFPHTGCPSTNRILPTGQDLPHIPQEIQPSSTWKLLVPMTKRTNKGFTTYVFSQAALPSCTFLPCNDIFGNRSDSMPCVLYLLEAKRPIVQIEHRYIGIGHCNRPGCIGTAADRDHSKYYRNGCTQFRKSKRIVPECKRFPPEG